MSQRANFLSLILLDALDDEDEKNIIKMLELNNVDASFVPWERGIAPIHYSCGMENEQMAFDMTKLFLENGANPNVRSSDKMTPLHVAAIYGRVKIVQLLLKFGANINVLDDERKMPIHYAIEECHFDVVQLLRDYICKQKLEKKKKEEEKQQAVVVEEEVNNVEKNNKLNGTPYLNKNLLAVAETSRVNENSTPNRVQYNYDKTSPYYINITHRRHKPQPVFPKAGDSSYQSPVNDSTRAVNIFSLTQENLSELVNRSGPAEHSRRSLIENWRERVRQSRSRKSILKEFDNVADLVDSVMESDELNFTNTLVREKSTNNEEKEENEKEEKKYKKNIKISLGKLIQNISQAHLIEDPNCAVKETDSSYQTVPEMQGDAHESNTSFIKSPNRPYYLQMTEAYVHTDDENGLVFYETKLLTNAGNKIAYDRQEVQKNAVNEQAALEATITTQSTNITVPLDYETDALRAELTTFGTPPGPITKTTKRLYIKRLVKLKRNTELMQEKTKQTDVNDIKFSVELLRTLRNQEQFLNVKNFIEYERQSATFFANQKDASNMREGHLKQSFIYMLIDPRVSCNLPGESAFLDQFTVWKRFLKSIFYVGKGKSSRPYAHLYDAMKTHSRLHAAEIPKVTQADVGRKMLMKNRPINLESFKSLPLSVVESKKLDRILNIWASGKGVVCLHVFHNIIPSEAYTREAAMIDALSLQHLTNINRGQYYGPAKNWTMKIKKYLGIALLYKAMCIYLAEGESQLSPSDLI